MTLYQGDCLWLMHAIPDASVDLVLCDLPYGTTACAWDFVISFEPLWTQYRRICEGAIVLTSAQPFTSALVMSNIEQFRYQWVWDKGRVTGFANAKRQPLRCFEDVLVFGGRIYNPQGLQKYGKVVKNGKSVGGDTLRGDVARTSGKGSLRTAGSEYVQEFTNYPKQILAIPSDTSKVHPTQKPVALMEYLIRTYTNEGMTVLDNCMGSGTTGVACVNTNREFIGIERDPNYFKIARERIEDAQFQQAIRDAERLFA